MDYEPLPLEFFETIPRGLKTAAKKLLTNITEMPAFYAPPIIMAPPSVVKDAQPSLPTSESPKGFLERVAEDMRKMQPEVHQITNIGVGSDNIPVLLPTEGIPYVGNVNLECEIPLKVPHRVSNIVTKEFKLATHDAKQAYKNIAPAVAKLTLAPDNVKYKENLKVIATPLIQFANIASMASQASLAMGGHKRTWKGIGAAAQGAMSVGSSLNILATAKPGMSLGALTGGIGLAIGVISVAMSIFGDDDDDENELGEALYAIHNAVVAVHEAVIDMHKEMIECFQRMEELLIVSVVTQLNQINSRISRLEHITTQSFKELHTKELVDVVDAIKKEICGEHTLTSLEKKSYLRQLSSWIDNHSKSFIQTQSHRIDGEYSKIIELLTETNLIESLPLFLGELMYIMPELQLQGLDELPNLDVLSVACDVYIVASKRPGYGTSNTGVIKRASNMLHVVSKIIEVLKAPIIGDETCCDILHRQYDHFRFTIGQVVCKIRGDEVWTCSTKLCEHVKDGQDKVLLINLLDALEVRRLCIIRLKEMLGVSVVVMESKYDILQRPLCEYNQGVMTKVFKTDELSEFKRYLEMGTNQNTWNGWGSPLHYVTKYTATAAFVHLLFKTYTPTSMTGGTKYCMGDTWGVGSHPILHALNCALSHMAILFCANGFDIVDSNGKTSGFAQFNGSHMGNLYWWVESNSIPAKITLRIVKKMNNDTSEWNKVNLRAAYNYFKLCESGLPCSTDGFNMESLLLLTCVIGDLFPLKYYLSKTQTVISTDFLNTLIADLGITYLLLATHWKQTVVVDYLISLGAAHIEENTLQMQNVELEDTHVCGPMWKIGASLQPTVSGSKLNDHMDDTELKINTYLKLVVNTLSTSDTKIMNACDLFLELLTDVVATIPRDDKYITYINTNMMLLNDGMRTVDYKIICNALNCLNAILSRTPGYILSSMVSNLISDIKSSEVE